MIDIYKDLDGFIKELLISGYDEYSEEIKNAKLSGSMGSEILGLSLIELKKYSSIINTSEKDLRDKAESLIYEIEKILR